MFSKERPAGRSFYRHFQYTIQKWLIFLKSMAYNRIQHRRAAPPPPRYLQKGEMKMLDGKVAQLLNTQINKEFYSAYLYLYFSNFYDDKGLDGFANWYKVQAQEERDHAMLMMQYLQNNDMDVTLEAIDKPAADLSELIDPLKAGLTHERYVTQLIHTIYGAASEVKDFRTMQFLDWFVKEQGEEETNASDLVKKMELFGSDSRSLYLLDQELAARVYAAPSLVL